MSKSHINLSSKVPSLQTRNAQPSTYHITHVIILNLSNLRLWLGFALTANADLFSTNFVGALAYQVMSSSQAQPATTLSNWTNPGNALCNDQHKYHRFFIGPMPEKVISSTEAQLRKLRSHTSSGNGPTEDECLSTMVKDHAFNFFIREGGKAEDREESQESNTVEEMLKRWQDSEWGRTLLRRKKESHPTGHWVGGSFEIGNFLGINTIKDDARESNRARATSQASRDAPSFSAVEVGTKSLASVPASATSPLPPLSIQQDTDIDGLGKIGNHDSPDNPDAEFQTPNSTASSMVLLRPPLDSSPKSRTSNSIRARILKPSFSAVTGNGPSGVGGPNRPSSFLSRQKGKGKEKAVRYSDISVEAPGPSPPADVLARTGRDVRDTSAGAAQQSQSQTDLRWGDVVLRGKPSFRPMFVVIDNFCRQDAG